MYNEFIFPRREMEVLITDSEKRSMTNVLKTEVSEDKLAGGEAAAKKKRDNTRRDSARKRMRRAIASIEWYAKTQPDNQLEQVFLTKNKQTDVYENNVYEMVLAICNNFPDSTPVLEARKMRLIASLVSLGCNQIFLSISTREYNFIKNQIGILKEWVQMVLADAAKVLNPAD
jgi:hypothetical protein